MATRRQFMVAAIAGVTGLAAWRLARSSQEGAIVAVLRKRLHYLRLEEAGLQAYARDLVARQLISRSSLHWLDFAGPLYTYLPAPYYRNVLTQKLQHGEERVISLYLLSSDFFQNGADEGQVVRYREFYDPLQQLQACSTPFARPVGA
jgi:hypothetical protein